MSNCLRGAGKTLFLFAVLGIVLLFSSCDPIAEWVEIYVSNDSPKPISVTMERKYYDADYERDVFVTEFTGNVDVGGGTARHNGESGNYKITVKAGDTTWHYPKGGKDYEEMSEEVLFTFDGDQLRKGKKSSN